MAARHHRASMRPPLCKESSTIPTELPDSGATNYLESYRHATRAIRRPTKDTGDYDALKPGATKRRLTSSAVVLTLTQRRIERPRRLPVALARQRDPEHGLAIVSGGSGRIPQQFHLGARSKPEHGQPAFLRHDSSGALQTVRAVGPDRFTHPIRPSHR